MLKPTAVASLRTKNKIHQHKYFFPRSEPTTVPCFGPRVVQRFETLTGWDGWLPCAEFTIVSRVFEVKTTQYYFERILGEDGFIWVTLATQLEGGTGISVDDPPFQTAIEELAWPNMYGVSGVTITPPFR